MRRFAPPLYYNKKIQMAINVNTVYQTVLLILNKEQRGYMTPTEFNSIGTQVQLEIFEKYCPRQYHLSLVIIHPALACVSLRKMTQEC